MPPHFLYPTHVSFNLSLRPSPITASSAAAVLFCVSFCISSIFRRCENVLRSFALVAGAIFSTCLFDQTPHTLYGDWICWTLLCCYSFIHARFYAKGSAGTGLHYQDPLAFAIVVASIARSRRNVNWVMPFVAPITQMLLPRSEEIKLQDFVSNLGSRNHYLKLLACFVPASAASFILLPSDFGVEDFLTAFCFLVGVIAVIALLLRESNVKTKDSKFMFISSSAVCFRVLALFTIYHIFEELTAPILSIQVAPLVLNTAAVVAVAQLLFWITLDGSSQRRSYDVIAFSWTFSTISVQAATQTVLWVGSSAVVISMVTLWQMTISIPQTAFRRIFILFAFVPLCALFAGLYTRGEIPKYPGLDYGFGPTSDSGMWQVSKTTGPMHPIEVLVERANSQFSALLGKQSRTLTQAVAEYKRRYKRDPPPNFDTWFELCLEKNVRLVDEFDRVMQNLEPYWGVPPSELRRRVQSSFDAPSMMGVFIRDHNVSAWKDWEWHLDEYKEMINYGVDFLPDMDIIFDTFDEPRVVVPFDTMQDLLHPETGTLRHQASSRWEGNFTWEGRQPAWDRVTQSCPPNSPARLSPPAPPTEDRAELSFIADREKSMDLCVTPENRDVYGFVVSPSTLSFTDELVPVFSQGGPSTFQDIMYPPPYYLGGSNDKRPKADGPFEEKKNNLYWAGSSTGGWSDDQKTMRKFQRHRFVELANSKDRKVTLLTETAPNKWTPHEEYMDTLSDLFDVKFTTFYCVESETPECEEEMKFYRIGEGESSEQSYGSKLVIDVDGNGFSGRYYRLLRSRSTVLKVSLVKEWHDDWIMPWVHYVPVSMSMDELPEVVRFLSKDPRGNKVAENIANQGSNWAHHALRKEDQSLFLVRILMEYGRLLSDDRDTQGFHES